MAHRRRSIGQRPIQLPARQLAVSRQAPVLAEPMLLLLFLSRIGRVAAELILAIINDRRR